MKRLTILISALVFVTAVLMAGMLFVHRVETGQDNLEYVLQASALQHGSLSEAFTWHRPPGYAAWIAVTLRMAGVLLPSGLFSVSTFALYLVAALNVLLFALSAFVVFWWALQIAESRWLAAAVGLLFATNQIQSAMSSIISAEPLLILIFFLALLVWEGGIHRPNGSGRAFGVFALCVLLAAETKHQGLALALAAVTWIAFRRCFDRKSVLLALAAMAVIFGNLAVQVVKNPDWLVRLISTNPYATGETVSIVGRVERWLLCYPSAWADLLMPKLMDEYGLFSRLHLGVLVWPFVVVVSAVTLAGFVASVRRGFRLSHLFFLIYGGMLIVWPDYLQRYLLPVAPLGILFFVEGLNRIALQAPRGTILFRLVIGAMLIWSVATNVYAGTKNWTNIVRLWGAPPWAPERYVLSREDDFADYIIAGQWLGANTPSNAVVFCRKALFIELVAGRRCEYYSTHATPDDLWKKIEADAESSPVFILRDNFSTETTYGKVRELKLMPVLKEHAREFEVLHRTAAGSEILRVIQPR
jgi:hypothetical protein